MNRFLVVIPVVLAACAGQKVPTSTVHKVKADRLEIAEQDFTTFTPLAVVQLGNDKPVHVVGATYDVRAGGEEVGTGQVALDETVQPGEPLMLKAGEPSPYAEGEKLAQVLEIEGALPILMHARISSDSGDIYEFTRSGQVRTPRVPSVKVWHIEVVTYPDEDRLSLLFFVRVVNKNPFDIQLEELSYTLTVAGSTLVTDGVAGTKEVIGAATGGQIELPVDMTKTNFPEVKKYMRKWTDLPYELDGEVKLGVGRIPVTMTGTLGDSGDRFEESEEKDTSEDVKDPDLEQEEEDGD